MLALTVNDRPIPVAAVIENGRVLLPLRATANALGASVWYDPARRIVVVSRFSQRIAITPRIIANRSYVPLRFIAQSLGASVGYDGGQHLVRITDPQLRSAYTPLAPASSFTTPPPVSPPNPIYGDAATYGPAQFSFYTVGGSSYYPGDWMHFVLIAPAGGQASMQLCDLGYNFQIPSSYGNRYELNVPAPGGYWISNCRVSAQYTSWSGQTTYVPIPLYISLFTNAARYSGATPRPRATATPAPVPTPTFAPKPVRTREPVPVHTPGPMRTPEPTRPQPRPRPTP